jgi:hypothetical protein
MKAKPNPVKRKKVPSSNKVNARSFNQFKRYKTQWRLNTPLRFHIKVAFK